MAEGLALEAIGLAKSYGDHRALRGVDLRVRAGEIHGLLGPNGAGKTTVMRLLLGLAEPDAGVVRCLGGTAGSTEGRVPEGVAGYVETPQFYPYLSGRKNLRLMARLDGDARSDATSRVDEALAEVGLVAQADAAVGGYSAGMRQRLGLAAALLRDPRLLLLDEPTHSLDPAGARDLRDRVRRLAGDGVAVLLSSHDMAEVEELCTSLTIVHHGEVVFTGTVDELRSRAPAPRHQLHTSDDELARRMGEAAPGVTIVAPALGEGLEVSGDEAALDAYIVALGRAGVAVRSLARTKTSLESLFLRLTEEPRLHPPGVKEATGTSVPRQGDVSRAPPLTFPPPRLRGGGPGGWSGVRAVVGFECAKLAAQRKTWATLGLCLTAPFAFVAAIELQSSLPEDTLFGRFVKTSGFAVPLVVLGFAAAWAFPALASVIGGDIFSAEDRYGTWPTLLTRSRSRREIFAGKALSAALFSLASVCALGLASLAAGLLVVGRQPLIGLAGTLLSPGRSMGLVAGAWASVLPPVLGFTGLAVLLSVATRSSAAGVGLPVLLGLSMELFSLTSGPDLVRRLLLTSPFVAWHGLLGARTYLGPLVEGTALSVAYVVGCLAWAELLLRRRDIGG